MMAFDTSARPHELLKLKIKDIKPQKTREGKHFALITVIGKTGKRTLPLTDSLPYIKDRLLQHPQKGNENAILICSAKKNEMGTRSLEKVFSLYKAEYFHAFLERDLPEEDKQKIRNLLKKPFNPYIWRHTSLTDKRKKQKLNDAGIQQIAGWTKKSNMWQVYVHHFGNEGVNTILKTIETQKKPPYDSRTFVQFRIRPEEIELLSNCCIPYIGDNIAYQHGLHFCQEVYPYRNQKSLI